MLILKRLWILVAMGIGSLSFAAPAENLNNAGVILDGYDVVSYFNQAEPSVGSSAFQSKQGEVTYWFANAKNRDEFLKSPARYKPEFGGWCAYAVAKNKSKVGVDPKSFLIQDGRLLLFYKGIFNDTRKKWSSDKAMTAKDYLQQADENWPSVKGMEP